MTEPYEPFKAVNDCRYANALALSAEYAARFLDKAVEIAVRASDQPGESSAEAEASRCLARMTRPEVIAALVSSQAQIFAALSASLDEAGLEQALGEASSEISAAVRSLDRS